MDEDNYWKLPQEEKQIVFAKNIENRRNLLLNKIEEARKNNNVADEDWYQASVDAKHISSYLEGISPHINKSGFEQYSIREGLSGR